MLKLCLLYVKKTKQNKLNDMGVFPRIKMTVEELCVGSILYILLKPFSP